MKLIFAVILILSSQNVFAKIPEFIKKEVLQKNPDFFNSCSDYDLTKNPDKKTSSFKSLLPGSIGDIAEVLFHGGSETDKVKNGWIISYMRESVLNDDRLFEVTYNFLKTLRDKDLEFSQNYELTPISETPKFSVFELAQKASSGNIYYAIKAMTVYGHDNMANSLLNSDEHVQPSKSQDNNDVIILSFLKKIKRTLASTNLNCKILILENLKPKPNSALYLNGALLGFDSNLKYSENDINKGNEIAKNCALRFGTHDGEDTEFEWVGEGKAYKSILCNDGHSQYQGDYYHIIASTFLFCRTKFLQRSSDRFLGSIRDRIYLDNVKSYKIKRFKETSNKIQNKEFRKVIMNGLYNISKNKLPIDNYSTQMKISESEYFDAKVILDRFEFEVNFRIKQHKLGMEAGKIHCN